MLPLFLQLLLHRWCVQGRAFREAAAFRLEAGGNVLLCLPLCGAAAVGDPSALTEDLQSVCDWSAIARLVPLTLLWFTQNSVCHAHTFGDTSAPN